MYLLRSNQSIGIEMKKKFATNPKKRALILGGGFGGVYTAMYLEKLMRPDDNLEVMLINKENYMVFQPLLPEVISGSIDLLHCISPIRRLCPQTLLITREIEHIDLQHQTVTTRHGVRPQPLELTYDYLALGLGRENGFSMLPGFSEHAFGFKTMADALLLRNRILHALEEAEIEHAPETRRSLLTFVVVGGGFSGVEVAAEMNDFIEQAADAYPGLSGEKKRVVLIHSGERILPEMTEKLGLYAQKILEKRRIRLLLNERVIRASADAVFLDSGLRIPTRTLVSTIPSMPNRLLSTLDVHQTRGKLETTEYLNLINYTNTWAVGDCAYILQQNGNPAPPTAQFAVRQAKVAAYNILQQHRGEERQKVFSFSGLGKTGSLGRRSAVAEVMGVPISGILAWFFWRTLYWSKMPGIDRKVRVGIDWALNLILPRETVQLKMENRPPFAIEHFEAGEFVFRQGDIGDKMYVVARGEVEVLMTTRSGDQQIAILGKDQYFGEMALVSGEKRMAAIRTLTPVDLMAISQNDFNMLVQHIPAIKHMFSKEITRRQEENRKLALENTGKTKSSVVGNS